MNETRKIRWVLYHEPIELFIRTAEAFAKEIKKLTDGRIEIDVYTMSDYQAKFKLDAEIEPLELIKNGKVEMSQVQVNTLGAWTATDFYALELPFLFSSHDHATRVLEGDIGQGMLAGLKNTTPATGLAFTYSGGFRCVAAGKPIVTAEDLVGLKLTTDTNPVMVDTAVAFGCEATPIRIADQNPLSKIARHTSEAVDTTLPRYKSEANPAIHKFVSNTKHSLFLTTIIIGTDVWDSLNAEDQAAMRQAALVSSRLERQWSIDDGIELATNTKQQKELGFSFSEFSDVETAKLKQRAEVVYDKYSQFFTPGLVDGIIKG